MELRHLNILWRPAKSNITGVRRAGCAVGAARAFPADSGLREGKRLLTCSNACLVGVKLSPAGKLFLEDARRILQEVNDAAARADRVALDLSGTLPV